MFFVQDKIDYGAGKVTKLYCLSIILWKELHFVGLWSYLNDQGILLEYNNFKIVSNYVFMKLSKRTSFYTVWVYFVNICTNAYTFLQWALEVWVTNKYYINTMPYCQIMKMVELHI